MSMLTMTVVGVAGGAATAGLLGIVRVFAEGWMPRMTAHSEQRHQMIAHIQLQQAEAVQRWRVGLANARDSYRQWAAGPRNGDAPNVVGDEWFEGLRPHLSATGEVAKYRTAHEVSCDNATVALLSLEIGRVEREWMEEAKGRPRRARN